jgi:glucose-1-phosphate cytidylyltransferase
MKVAILAGGAGTRLAEETAARPKPMVEIGGRPLLWHIMMHYSRYGHRQFLIALGYKGEYIKTYFRDFASASGSLTVHTRTGRIVQHEDETPRPEWEIGLIETGQATLTGGRIRRLRPHIGAERFMLTWGDGLADVNLAELESFHRSHGRLATVTAVRPPPRYGHLDFEGDKVVSFAEKPPAGEGWINGAFFVLEPGVFDYIDGDDVMFEHRPMERLARDGQLMAYRHDGFWQCMDTLREKMLLQQMWEAGNPPWKTWE